MQKAVSCVTCGWPWDGHATAPGGGAQCNSCSLFVRIEFNANTSRDRVEVHLPAANRSSHAQRR